MKVFGALNRFSAIAAFLLLMFSTFAGASTAFLPNTSAVGYPYAFNVTISPSGGRVTNCQLNVVDRLGTTIKAWNIDGSNFPMQTNTDGFLHSFVWVDNSFVTNEEYLFTIYCGSFSQTQLVTIEQGGSSVWNIAFLNGVNWFAGRPDEGLLMSVLVLGGLLVLGVAYSIIVKGRVKLPGG